MGDFSVEQYKEGILAYQDMILQYGFTGAYDPWLYANGNAVEAIKELDQEGRLKIYFRGAYWMDPHRGPEQVTEIAAARERDNENAGMFEIRAVKFFMDGVLESLTAFLLEPYAQAEGRPEGWRGDQIWEPENMKKCVAAVDAAGMGIHVHCAGDAAVKQTLDAIEYAQSVAGKNDRRHCITHIFLVDQADLQRFKELGVVAMLNAYWAQIDETYFVNGTYTGAERIAHTFPVRPALSRPMPVIFLSRRSLILLLALKLALPELRRIIIILGCWIMTTHVFTAIFGRRSGPRWRI